MLNNITNFFNLIKTGKVKTQLDATDLLPIGTRDLRFSGQYQPTMIKYGDFISGLVGGSNGQVLFNDNDTIAGASTFYWDKVNNRVGIGTSTPTTPLYVNGATTINNRFLYHQGNSSIQYFMTSNAWSGTNTIFFGDDSSSIIGSISYNHQFDSLAFNVNAAERFRVANTGNLLINTTTDAGYNLDVNGTFRASDSLIASSSGGGAYKLTVQHTGVGQGNTFRVIQLGYSMIDVNTSGVSFMPFPSPSGTVGITNWTSTGGSGLTFFTKNSEFTPQGGTQALPLIKFPNPSAPIVMGATATVDLRAYLTVSGAFNATSGLATGQQILSTLTATANNDALVGLDITPTFTNGAFTGVKNLSIRVGNSYGPYSSTLGHGVELNTNVGISGTLDVGGDSSVIWLWRSGARVNGYNIGANYVSPNFSHLFFGAGGTKQMLLVGSNGNLILQNGGTFTDAGFRLDVNGTARVNNIFYVTNPSFIGNIRIEAIANNQQRITGANGENIVFGADNVIRINATETYVSNSLLGQGFWIQSNGATVIGAQAAAAASSILDLRSTTRGFLPPRMDSTQKNAISGPAAGLMIYDTTLNRPCFYNGTSWITL